MKTIIMMECVKLPSANQYLPEPFKLGEKVIYVSGVTMENQPPSFVKQFIKVKRIASKKIVSESRNCFRMITKKKKL